jgi:hypothetical protein
VLSRLIVTDGSDPSGSNGVIEELKLLGTSTTPRYGDDRNCGSSVEQKHAASDRLSEVLNPWNLTMRFLTEPAAR